METELLFGRDEGSVPTGQSLCFARTEALIEKSIMLNSGFAKDNINAKINTKINKWLTFDFNARLSLSLIHI